MPPVLALACGTGGAVATRPAHAAQAVVPSAICAPHTLQKAIEVSSSASLGAKDATLQPAQDLCQATLQVTKKLTVKQSTIYRGRKRITFPRPAARRNRRAAAVGTSLPGNL